MDDIQRRKLIGRTLKQFRKAARLTQEQLAGRLAGEGGLDQATISKIETGAHGSPEIHLEAIAGAMGARASQVLQAVEAAEDGAEVGFLPPAVPGLSALPLIGWVRAGKWDEVNNPFDPDVAEDYVHTAARVSRRAYALRVKGDSMTNPRGWPTFPPGTTIVVDPKVQAESGSLVIAQLDADEEATFKKLVRDGGQTYLVPLNPQFPTLPVGRDVRVCGVVVAVVERAVSEA
jgi:SOS-response transcriptional repressor LexA